MTNEEALEALIEFGNCYAVATEVGHHDYVGREDLVHWTTVLLAELFRRPPTAAEVEDVLPFDADESLS